MWSHYNPLTYARPTNKLYNKTKPFLDFLKLDISPGRAGQEFSYMAEVKGTTGSGKSTLADILISLHLKINPKRYVVIYKGDDNKIKDYNRICPKYMKGRFVNVDHIVEINELGEKYPPHSFIFFVDEAGMDASAKEALSKEMRPIVKMAKKSRHLKVIIIMLDQTKSILKDYRTMCHFHFYKRIGEDFPTEYNDSWAKKYQRKLVNLEDHQVAFKANYKYFRNAKNKIITKGLLNLPMHDYVPWLEAELENTSQYLRHENVDHDFAKSQKDELKISEYAKIVYNEFVGRLKKSKTKIIMKRWLIKKYPVDAYILDTNMEKIYGEALLIDYFKSKEEEEGVEEEKRETSKKVEWHFKKGMEFADYCKEYYTGKGESRKADMCYELLSGLSQSGLASKWGISVGKINTDWKKLRQAKIGYLFEDWCGLTFDLIILGGNKSIVDAISKTGQIFTIKFRYGANTKSISYKKSDPKNFRPSNMLANYYKVPYGLIHIFPTWDYDNQLKILKVDPFPELGSDHFNVAKDMPSLKITDIPPVEDLQKVVSKFGRDKCFQYISKIMHKIELKA